MEKNVLPTAVTDPVPSPVLGSREGYPRQNGGTPNRTGGTLGYWMIVSRGTSSGFRRTASGDCLLHTKGLVPPRGDVPLAVRQQDFLVFHNLGFFQVKRLLKWIPLKDYHLFPYSVLINMFILHDRQSIEQLKSGFATDHSNFSCFELKNRLIRLDFSFQRQTFLLTTSSTTKFFLKFLEDINSFLIGHWYSSLGLLSSNPWQSVPHAAIMALYTAGPLGLSYKVRLSFSSQDIVLVK